MINKKNLLFLFLAGFISITLTAQEKDNYIPPSPEAAALSKSLNFKSGTHTGVPSISVPLYDVEAAGLNLPITLSYHAGGFRINEQSGTCGLGWSMSLLDLQVSRQIFGRDDFGPSGYYFNSFGPWSDPEADLKTRIELSKGNTDHMADRFSFRLLNSSGSFYYEKIGTASSFVKRPITIPTEDVQIEFLYPSAPMQGFKITDTDGTVYIFNVIETTTTNEGNEQTGQTETLNTTWKCSRIINAQKTDTIHFDYVAKLKKQYSYSHQERIEVWDQTYGAGPDRTFPNDITETYADDVIDNTSLYHFGSPKYKVYSTGKGNGFHILWCTDPQPEQMEDGRWKCVIGNNCDDCPSGAECIDGKCVEYSATQPTNCPVMAVDYEYPSKTGWGADRSATAITGMALYKIRFRTGNITFGYDPYKLYLASVIVTSYQAAIVKTIEFGMKLTQDLFNGGQYLGSDGTRFLKTVKIDYTEKYSFDYSRESFCYSNHMKGSDAWGGVNFSTTDFTGDVSVPRNKLSSTDQACQNNNYIDYWVGNTTIEPDSSKITAGILTQIRYPSGGKTEFVFSCNQYKKNNVIRNAGGLRINEIQYYEGKSPYITWRKIYKYGENEDGAGILNVVPSVSYTNGESTYAYEQTQFYGENIWERKTTIVPNAINDLFYSSGAPVHYAQVAEYMEEGGRTTGKKLYQYDEDAATVYKSSYRINGTNLTINGTDWHLGKLKAEVDCKFITGIDQYGGYYESFDTVRTKRFQYEEFETGQVYTGQVFSRTLGKNEAPPFGGPQDPPPPYLTTSDFAYYKNSLRAGNKRIYQEEEEWKENGQKLKRVTTYSYSGNSGSARMQPVVTTTTLSDAITETRTSYAFDYTSNEGFLGELKARHMISLPVEQVTLVNGNVVSAQFNEYRNDGTGLVNKVFVLETDKPIPVNEFKFSSEGAFTPDTRYAEKSSIVYGTDLKPVMVETVDNIPGSYIWGYKNSLPVAKVTNARHDQVYFNGFEEDASATNNEANSHTGTKYKSGSFQVQFTPATAGVYYISYWYYDQKWKWEELPYTTGQTITKARIDDVRVYPKGSQMTTFTYKPLVGITSVTDANNITSYYQYDAIGRLETIRDDKGNILKTYIYHYRQ